MTAKIPVSILGATGTVGSRVLPLLAQSGGAPGATLVSASGGVRTCLPKLACGSFG